jgi:endonuclease YncB( thermonuclease family)
MKRVTLRTVLVRCWLVTAFSAPAVAIETIVGVADRVVDGTTVEIEGRIVRFWGCEAPQASRVEATAAAAALAELIGGQLLACIEVDQAAGQTTARCYLQQVDLCAAMVGLGHAADSLGLYADEQARAARAGKPTPQ